jgi:hypothetical protein
MKLQNICKKMNQNRRSFLTRSILVCTYGGKYHRPIHNSEPTDSKTSCEISKIRPSLTNSKSGLISENIYE